MALYRLEEISLVQKSKLNWLHLSDENTSLFHQFLAAKKKKEKSNY